MSMNKDAKALGKLRHAKKGKKPAGKNLAAQALANLRWKGVSAEERSVFMKQVSDAGGGRPRKSDVPRCPCGVMTLKRAETRGRSKTHQEFCTFYKRKVA